MERRAFRVDPQLLEFARVLRTVQTTAEEKLWRCLQNRRLNGFKFRRQVPIDRYVADFYCAETT
jgi:very-short-patch-repair endonuclease